MALPLSLVLTACDDNDDDTQDTGLAGTEWTGEADGFEYELYFGGNGHFEATADALGGYTHESWDGLYKTTSKKITLRDIQATSYNFGFYEGSYSYKLQGSGKSRLLIIYGILADGSNLYLEEIATNNGWDWDEE